MSVNLDADPYRKMADANRAAGRAEHRISVCQAAEWRWAGGASFGAYEQSMEWTWSIRWIHNPVQSRRIWIGLDHKYSNSADCAMCIPYLDIWGNYYYRNSDVWSLTLKSAAEHIVVCSKILTILPGRYLSDTYSVMSGLDWTGFSFWFSSWMDWIMISGSWIWTGLDHFNSIHFIPYLRRPVCPLCHTRSAARAAKLYHRDGSCHHRHRSTGSHKAPRTLNCASCFWLGSNFDWNIILVQLDCERLHSDTMPPFIVCVTESADSILHRQRNGGGGTVPP